MKPEYKVSLGHFHLDKSKYGGEDSKSSCLGFGFGNANWAGLCLFQRLLCKMFYFLYD